MRIYRLATQIAVRTLLALGAISGGILASLEAVKAQSYPIDCAILLCLSGGWPSDPVCSAAKAEFTRRATPYPVEPPLQIWNCPMQASYNLPQRTPELPTILEAVFRLANNRALQIPPAPELVESDGLRFVQPISQKADVDISSPEFDFVRSIGVYQIEAWQGMRGSDGGECRNGDASRTGTYGTQGDFSWRPSHVGEAPPAFDYPRGGTCPEYNIRSVFVDWRDYEGNYGSERIDY